MSASGHDKSWRCWSRPCVALRSNPRKHLLILNNHLGFRYNFHCTQDEISVPKSETNFSFNSVSDFDAHRATSVVTASAHRCRFADA